MKKTLSTFLLMLLLNGGVLAQAPTWDWCKGITGPLNNSEVKSIVVDAYGNVYTTGDLWGTKDFDPGPGIYNLTSAGSYDAFILKTDNRGNFIWAINIGSTHGDYGSTILVNKVTNNDIYVMGSFSGTVDFNPDSTQDFNLATGSAGGSPDFDIFVLQLDSAGAFKDVKQMGGASQVASSSVIDDFGNLYITGSFYGGSMTFPLSGLPPVVNVGTWDIFITKMDSALNFTWAKSIGGNNEDRGTALTIDSLSNLYLTGTFIDSIDIDPHPLNTYWLKAPAINGYKTHMYVTKLDSGGNFVWAKPFSCSDLSQSAAICTGNNHNIYITGSIIDSVDFNPDPNVIEYAIADPASGFNVFVVKLDTSGSFKWVKQFIGTGVQRGFAITEGMDSSIYIAGYYVGVTDFNPDTLLVDTLSGRSLFVCKLNLNGDYLWAKGTRGGGSIANCIVKDNAENIYVAGRFGGNVVFDNDSVTGPAGSNAFLAKLGGFSTGIKNPPLPSALSIYPNPATTQLKFSYNTKANTTGSVAIYNNLGQKVFEETGTSLHSKTIDLVHFPKGLYHLIINCNNGTGRAKFVKE